MTINSIVLSCGHVVSTLSEGHNAAVAGFDREGNKCVRHMVLCSGCLELERQHDSLSAVEAQRDALLEANEAFSKRQQWWNEKMFTLEQQRDALLEALKEITPSMPPVDAPCHYGIVPQEKCGHCGRIAKARAVIKAVEGTK